jgi:peptidoglycan/LPS O-acetylase OafA/YrhL
LFCYLVIFFHVYNFPTDFDVPNPLVNAVYKISVFSVAYFAAVSGFYLGVGAEPAKYLTQVKKFAKLFIPAYLVLYVVNVLEIAFRSLLRGEPFALLDMISFSAPHLLIAYPIVLHLWYLLAMVLIFVLLYLLNAWGRPRVAFILAALGWIFCVVPQLAGIPSTIPRALVWLFPVYVGGAMAKIVLNKLKGRLSNGVFSVLVVLVLVLLCLLSINPMRSQVVEQFFGSWVLFPFIALALMVICSLHQNLGRGTFFPEFAKKYTLNIYIIHFPVLLFVDDICIYFKWSRHYETLHQLMFFAVVAALTTGLAVLYKRLAVRWTHRSSGQARACPWLHAEG